MFLNDAITRSPAIGLPVAAAMPCCTSDSRVGGVVLDVVVRRHLRVHELLHHVGVVLQEARGDDELRRHVLTLRPQRRLVDEDLAAAFGDQPSRPRLGHPRALDVAGLEGVERRGVVLRLDGDVTATGGVGVEALLLQPRAQATSWVLPSCGVATILPLRSAALLMSGFTTKYAPPEDGAGDHPHALVELGPRGDRGARADVAGVERLRPGTPGSPRCRS